MTRWCLVAWVMLGLSAVSHADDALPGEIRVASETWRDYTHADGTGLGWDIMRKVFEPAGVQLSIRSVPYMRSIGLVQRGGADAWMGAYRDEVSEGVFFPRWHYDADRIVALGLRDKPAPTLDNLGDYRLVWVRGYGFQEYLPNVRDYQEVQRRGGILGTLDYGYADYYIDAVTEVDEVLADAPDRTRYRVSDLTRLPVFLGFADTPRGRQLAELFDRRMDELVTSGELRPIFHRWQQPYPFD